MRFVSFIRSNLLITLWKITILKFSRVKWPLYRSIFKTRSLASIYVFKVNNWNTRTMCEIYSELTIKTTRWRLDPMKDSDLNRTLNRFHALFWCFNCYVWKSKRRLGHGSCRLGHLPGHRWTAASVWALSRVCSSKFKISLRAYTLLQATRVDPKSYFYFQDLQLSELLSSCFAN